MSAGKELRRLESLFKVARQIETALQAPEVDTAQLKGLWDVLEHRTQHLGPKSLEEVGGSAKVALERRDGRSLVVLVSALERILARSIRDSDWLVPVNTKDRSAEIEQPKHPLIFILENVRSAFNVGSIIRTADALQVDRVYCCGYTPNVGHRLVQKTALGSDKVVTVYPKQESEICSVDVVVKYLKETGYKILALETSAKAQSLHQIDFPQLTAFLLGNERFGLTQEALSLADGICEIPMGGTKNSLNVAVAAAVAGYTWLGKQESKKPR